MHYQLPPASDQLKGQRLGFAVKDERPERAILTPAGQARFGNFSGNISFSLARDQERGFLIGVFQVPDLFRQGIERQLKSLGLDAVSEDPGAAGPTLEVVLREFSLDYAEYIWRARVGYEARLLLAGRTAASRNIAAQVERVGLAGRQAAHSVMGEAFSEALNRLDLPALLLQAEQSR